MDRLATLLIGCCMMCKVYAQPYLDIVSIGYTNSPDAAICSRNNTGNRFQYYNASMNLPIIFKKDSSMLLISSFAERWNIRIDDQNHLPSQFQSLALPVNFIKPLTDKWEMFLSVIPRWNGEKNEVFTNRFQMGGAILAGYKKTKDLTWKFGIYYNGEFSGPYFLPLLGIDWRINKKNSLFGIMPGNLVFEHRAGKYFYWGADFTAITNTYDISTGFVSGGHKYLRISDNQLSIYGDYVLAKNIYLHISAGHSVFRSFKTGVKDDASIKYDFSKKMNDNILCKLSLNYRIRF